ncbi:unnamed protein product [Cuscuta campestris]|uniref:HMA domain-containing protein n=1 Tax=Cuscuta campestris TaxID=132261 RepID=A0A484LYD5_9ASTE|nr:unnamed protein product [Cuscuta campestris]
MSQTVVLKVGMSCSGCVGAVKRVLGKMEGVESFDIDQEAQKVTVKGNVTPESVLQTVSKTGKKTSFWEEAEVSAKPSEAVVVGDVPPTVSETKKESSLGEEKGADESGAKPSEGIAIA